ncbi:MAG: PaaI family thioesterase [Acidimicrobiia bacterium]|nr:PaaI family thioesterase [Acidimicrobiia bacterium]
MALTDEQQEQRRRGVADLMPKTPFIALLGLVVETFAPDDVTMRLPFRPELTNDGSVYHGGVVASVIDTTGALAAWSNHDFDKGVRASTVSMSVQFVGTAKNSDLLCHARTVKRGRELIFTEIDATDTDSKVVAHAVQTYRIV